MTPNNAITKIIKYITKPYTQAGMLPIEVQAPAKGQVWRNNSP